MKQLVKLHSNLSGLASSHLSYEDKKHCPICKTAISPVFISGSHDTSDTASIFNYCRNCENTFLTKYLIKKSPEGSMGTVYYNAISVIYSAPNHFKQKTFDQNISDLSERFVKIYNQSLAAETSSLDEIAGIGYRKALEFLIKDFAIHENPDDEEKIKSMLLGPCIKNYISDERIKTLAQRSAWIGNDETHYIRKQEDRDISDMKAFIKAAVYFIGMVLITEDAASMEPK